MADRGQIINPLSGNGTEFQDMVMHFPVGILVLKGKDLSVDLVNEAYLTLIGSAREKIDGKRFRQLAPWDIFHDVEARIIQVLDTGKPYSVKEYQAELSRNGKSETVYFNLTCTPYSEKDEIKGATLVVMEITDLVSSRHKISESEKRLHDLVMQSPIPVTIFRGTDYHIEMANDVMYKNIWRKKPEEVIGKKLFDVFPELKEQKYPQLLVRVYETGISYTEADSMAIVEGNDGMKVFYLDFEYAPLFETDGTVSGIMVTVNDVSEKVLARKKLEESETRMKMAIESAEIGTFEWDLSHSKFIYSERFAAIFGYAADQQLVQQDFIDKIHPDDRKMRAQAHADSVKTGFLFYESRILLPDNTIRWIRVNGKTLCNERKEPARMYGTTIDITSQKTYMDLLEVQVRERTAELERKNIELKESEERYHRMTEEVQDYAIILLDQTGKILNWNKGAQNIKGYSDDEIIGKNFNIFYREEDRIGGLPELLLNQAASTGRAVHEGWRIRKDRTVFWGSILITALHDEQDNVIGFSKVTRDLTERKIAEDRARQYTSELEFKNQELEQFAYVASHDLQEPLRKIQTFTGMLQSNLHDELAVNKYLDKITQSAARMTELIKAVLNYSSLSSSEIRHEEIDLNEVRDLVLTDLELLITEKNAVVKSDELPVIKGISLQLNQLFFNLIGNSLKFCDKTPEITITARFVSGKEIIGHEGIPDGNRYLELVFADNGIGFEKQYTHQIFTMFQRLNDKYTYGGSGIGLALCKRIAENHHGFIHATSVPGRGASFFIYLPA